jgi:conserved hypothetical protein
MKVFISHQQRDSMLAKTIYDELKKRDVDVYLDLLDDLHNTDSKYLTQHLKNIVKQSTDILVVMTKNTWESWWVPFEIGMAAQKDLRTVTYLQADIDLPEYLDYWPRLKKIADIQEYIKAHHHRLTEENRKKSIGMESSNFSNYEYTTEDFYNTLKGYLNQ